MPPVEPFVVARPGSSAVANVSATVGSIRTIVMLTVFASDHVPDLSKVLKVAAGENGYAGYCVERTRGAEECIVPLGHEHAGGIWVEARQHLLPVKTGRGDHDVCRRQYRVVIRFVLSGTGSPEDRKRK